MKNTRPPAPSFPKPLALIAAAALGVHLWLGFGFIRVSAPTYDESIHLASGYSYLMTGRYRLNIMDHPPLAEMWAALPLLPMRPHLFLQHPDWLDGRLYHYSDQFLYRNVASAEAMLNAARGFNLATLGPLLGLALLLWAWREAGAAGAAGAAAAYAFSPALVSNHALVTTDGASAACFFAACALAAAASRRSDPAWGVWLAAGALAGLAMAAKFNMIVLPPLLLGLAVADRLLRPPPRGAVPAGVWLALGLALAVLAACYRFGQAPLFWEGLRATLGRMGQGRGAFFLGDHSTTGWWTYFPAALAVKTPLAGLALAALGLAWLPRLGRARALWLWAPPALYLAAAVTSKVQIGYRHVLPVVPFLILWAGCGAAWLWERGRGGRAALAVLLAWLSASVLRAHPHQLAYFNELAGGPANGYRWLVDSNLDWGQELKGLGAELRALGGPPIYFCYFGTADPAAYGIRYVPVGFVSNVERAGDPVDPAASGRVLFAVSATNLQGTYYSNHGVFAWLRQRTPLTVIGHAIFLYELTADPEGRARLAALLPPDRRGTLASRRASARGALLIE